MSARRIASNKTLPPNPTWIEFPRSDGDSDLWPKNTTRVIDAEAQVNFMRPVPESESLSILWRVGVAKELAKRLGLVEGPAYVLKSFPEGYHMYDHNKGLASAPRHDPYLIGSVNVNRFRSVNEFIPHALWLMQDPTLTRANCECKYCTKKPQRVITDNLGLSSKRSTPRASPGASQSASRAPRATRRADAKPYTAVRRAPRPIRSLTGPTQSMVPERDNDIKAAFVGDEFKQKRMFRRGELLWCALLPPISGKSGQADSIMFWPGVVEDVNLKVQPISEDGKPIENAQIDMSKYYEEQDDAVETRPTLYSDSQRPLPRPEGVTEVPWKVRHWNVYTMKLLAVTHKYHVSDDQVLPYLAYAPPTEVVAAVHEELRQMMDEIPAPQMESDLDKIFSYNPCLPMAENASTFQSQRFNEAAAPYSLALQIASHLSECWTPTDDWDCKFTIPVFHAPPPPPPPPPQAQGLASLITQSMANNATADLEARATAQARMAEISGAPGLSPEQLQSRATRLLGSSLHPSSPAVTQLRYQGLWWGAERIWTDELVRLKLARCQFAPAGGEIIYPPAGPSASALAHLAAHQGENDDLPLEKHRLGASEKGLFFRIEGLFVVEVPKSDSGVVKECRASGIIYELADADWEEDPDVAVPAAKGKGKERATDDGDLEPPFADTSNQASEAQPPLDGSASATSGLAGPSFMSEPSPLKPPPLPNPDPTVPIAETAADTLAQTTPNKKSKKRTLNSQLSHPALSTPYPLPDPPKGFKFRPILHPGHEVVISLSLISGRYYPHLLEHPLMAHAVQRALALPQEQGGLYENKHLWAMDGLLSGVYLSMDPTAWKPSRLEMMRDADNEARLRFREIWEARKLAREQTPPPLEEPQPVASGSQQVPAGQVPIDVDAMDVDGQ